MKRIILPVLALCVAVCAAVIPTAPAVKDGCYSITNADELYGFAAIVNGTLDPSRAAEPSACGKLENDILANDTTERARTDTSAVEPLALWTPMKNFSGSFDGQGYTIWKLENADDSTQNSLGFIASVVGGTKNAPVVIRDLVLRNSYFAGRDTIGGVVAKNGGNLLLENVSALLKVRGRRHVATLVGRNEGTLTIKGGDAYFVKAQKFAGAAVGSNSGTMTVDSLSLSKHIIVTEHYENWYDAYVQAISHAGLILGANEKNAELKVTNVSSDHEADVFADSLVGGFVGLNDVGAKFSISKSSFTSYLLGGEYGGPYVGGFVGMNRGSVDITNSFVNGIVSGLVSGCFVGANENSLSITNSYSNCFQDAYTDDPVVGECRIGLVTLSSVFYKALSTKYSCANKYGAKPVTAEEFGNGTVAVALHTSKGGEVWGQDLDNREGYPMLGSKFGDYTFKVQYRDTLYVTKDTLPYKYMTKKDLPEPSKNGYEFVGWYYEGKSDSLVTEIAEGEYGNKVLVAKWEGLPVIPPQDSLGCYLISSTGELYGFNELLENRTCAKLTADIVVNKDFLGPDGQPSYENYREWSSFSLYRDSLIFDGQGHTISGLRGAGFVPTVYSGSHLVVKNLGLVDSYFAAYYAGAFVGKNEGGVIIDNSFSTSTVRNGVYAAGGLIGENSAGAVISNSYNKGCVEGGAGLVGVNGSRLLIVNSYNETPFDGSSIKCGGNLLGKNEWNVTVVNSYNIGQENGPAGSARLIGGTLPNRTTAAFNSYYVDRSTECPASSSIGYSQVDNVYYLGTCVEGDSMVQVSAEQLGNGYVLDFLHDYVVNDSVALASFADLDGTAWGQDIGVDPYPVFKEKVVAKSSSSSAESSSSSAESSSSSVKSSSSNTPESSSSSTPESSSSSAKSSLWILSALRASRMTMNLAAVQSLVAVLQSLAQVQSPAAA